jgi:hypothetical protein
MSIDAPTATIVAAGLIAGATIAAAAIGYRKGRASRADDESPSPIGRLLPGIHAIIDSSNVPMYFTDQHLTCSIAIARFVNCWTRTKVLWLEGMSPGFWWNGVHYGFPQSFESRFSPDNKR